MLKSLFYEIFKVIYVISCDFMMSIPIHHIRKLYFRTIIKSCGKHVYVGRNIDIRSPRGIVVGDYVVINKRVLLDGRHGLTIGNNVDIAQDAYLWTRHHDYNDDYHSGIGGGTFIDDYTWICCRSNILPGVKIGKGAVVASNAVVVSDVPPMTVVGGVPAKKIAERTSKLLYKLDFHPKFCDKL